MSDFVTRDILHELWKEILKQHWTYFDSEESVAKLENRKKLEDCLKEFLCIVQHDRKFFLPETADVLKKSIRDLKGFSAQKAIRAFEAISQYANNLFTQPWRMEFRVLKLYSGFYQHEIKSNLLDAEILFEAMGYRRLSEDTLILDGPICPDQVTNVSRDAMTAYMELHIIKQIYTGLDAFGINCSWLDIFRYREKNTGDASEAVKTIAYSIEEKRFRSRQKPLLGDNYSGCIDVQPSNYFATNRRFCSAQCQCPCSYYQQAPSLSRNRVNPQNNGMCCVPEHQQLASKTATSSVYSNIPYPVQYQQNHHSGEDTLSQMSHSRSLDHYNELDNHHNTLLHRHSFDHQHQGCAAHYQNNQSQQLFQKQHYYQQLNQSQQGFYESPYDCINTRSVGGGSSNISYAVVDGSAGTGAVAGSERDSGVGNNCNLNSNSTYSHAYNVSGNRFPLPLNISNQLSAYDNILSSSWNGPQEPTYAHISDQHLYSSISKLPQHCLNNITEYNQPADAHGIPNPLFLKESDQRQRSCQSDQLINFEDATIMPTTNQHQQFDPINSYHQNCENHIADKLYSMCNIKENLIPPPGTLACQQHGVGGKSLPNDDTYAKPSPRENRKQNTLNLRRDRGDTDASYESSHEDFVSLGCQENSRSTRSSNYVLQNPEKNGYSKDVGESEDLLVQSLDLDSLNIVNDVTGEREKSNYSQKQWKCTGHQEDQSQQEERKPKNKTENAKSLTINKSTMENSDNISSTKNAQKPKMSVDNSSRKIKSALKQNNESLKSNISTKVKQHPNKMQPQIKDNKKLANTANNNNNDSSINSSNGTTQRKTPPKKSSSALLLSTQMIVTPANEWSCSFCTFLNPHTKRICEMCCRSKDFNLDSSTTSTANGGTTVTHNTPTCA